MWRFTVAGYNWDAVNWVTRSDMSETRRFNGQKRVRKGEVESGSLFLHRQKQLKSYMR